MSVFLYGCLGAHAEQADTNSTCGNVGLRPLPRFEQDLKSNHGGSWAGLPTFEKQKGNYPFVAEHLDVVKGWLDGDFKTRRLFALAAHPSPSFEDVWREGRRKAGRPCWSLSLN